MPIKTIKKRTGIEHVIRGVEGFSGLRFKEPSSPLEFAAAFDFCQDSKSVPPSAQEMLAFARESGISGKYWTRLLSAVFMNEQTLYIAFDDSPDSRILRTIAFSDGYEADKEGEVFRSFIGAAERAGRVLNLYALDESIKRAYLRAMLGSSSKMCNNLRLPTPEEAFKLVHPEKYMSLWRAGEIRSIPKIADIRPIVLENDTFAFGSFREQNIVYPVINPGPFKKSP